MRTLIIVTFLASLACTASANDFDMAASGCMPDRRTLQNHAHFITGGTVKTAGLAGVQLNCMIPVIDPPSHLGIVYAQSASGQVSAAYCKMHKGTLTSDCGSVRLFADDYSGAVTSDELTFTDTYDPSQYYYWIILSISRDSLTEANGSPTIATLYEVTLW